MASVSALIVTYSEVFTDNRLCVKTSEKKTELIVSLSLYCRKKRDSKKYDNISQRNIKQWKQSPILCFEKLPLKLNP